MVAETGRDFVYCIARWHQSQARRTRNACGNLIRDIHSKTRTADQITREIGPEKSADRRPVGRVAALNVLPNVRGHRTHPNEC
jgi:hypothetical protein